MDQDKRANWKISTSFTVDRETLDLLDQLNEITGRKGRSHVLRVLIRKAARRAERRGLLFSAQDGLRSDHERNEVVPIVAA